MWGLAAMAGTALAVQAANAGSALALSMATGAAGLSLLAAEEVRRQSMRAGAEALEALEDFIAETPKPPDDLGSEPRDEVIVGHVRGTPAVVPTAPLLAVMHTTSTRLRLQFVLGPPRDGGQALADAVAAFPGVLRAAVRPMTGSLLVMAHPGQAAGLAERLARAGLLQLAPVGLRHPAWIATRLSLLRADMAIRLRSGGEAGLGDVIGGLAGHGSGSRATGRETER